MTANRELERDAAETEKALATLKDQSQGGLLLLRQELDSLRASNAELSGAVEADRRSTRELDVILGGYALPLLSSSVEISFVWGLCAPRTGPFVNVLFWRYHKATYRIIHRVHPWHTNPW